MSFASFILAGIIMMFATGGTPPPMAQAQSFTIHTRLTNTSGFIHKLRHKLTRPLHLDQGIVFPSMPSGLVYVSAHFGTPPLTINLALDTLFPFTWVQTVGCRRYCFNLSYPFSNFDPRKSTTFQLLPPNNTTICSPPIAHPSRSGSLCVYDAGYSGGIFGIDEFQLLSPFPSSSSTNRIAFGCDLQSQVDFNGGWDFNPIGGMIGLGKGHPSSIVSQLGSDRYSYCLPGFAQSQSGQPTLNFGSDAIIDASATNVQTTPLISSTLSSAPEQFYNYLNMTAVTVNGDVVYMMPENSSANLVLLDSGSPDSWLIEDAIFSLQDSIVKYFAESYGWKHPKIESESARGYPCCYDLPSNLASVVFPKVAIQFLGGASLELHNAFEIFAAEHEFCMVIREGAPNVIGVYQQLGYRFLFDQAQSELSFAPNMC
ncbi:PREDICTED: aspartic proteinase CDR1-like [Fragaria vesca subsp. vesca]|uniref:aspartic proteinase CDR1-like n=1 Tax=Fragaria vesca subsp. vesca TaxID=101020 RepID=UPI0002C3764D|nr:PREDICTED: aspartic proteinase CDR1-like [Fragaria vesca subsp. vesca]